MNKQFIFGSSFALVAVAVIMFGSWQREAKAGVSDKFTCDNVEMVNNVVEDKTYPITIVTICTGHELKCVFSTRLGENGPSGVSCVKSGGLFK